MTKGWIGVDLDGTLAKYDGWQGEDHIGNPIPLMTAKVRQWLKLHEDVRILTARAGNGEHSIAVVRAWCKRHLGRELPVTDRKDFQMRELWDDRAVRVQTNTGRLMSIIR
jgi:hypothetical protein